MKVINSDLYRALEIHFRVIKAILIRDMRTRFGSSHVSYIVAIGWPLSHLVGIVATFSVMHRMLPFGTDSIIFISTGALPYILCFYPARMMSQAFAANITMLGFPVVQPIDVIIARMVLEALTAFSVAIVFVVGLWAIDLDIVPIDIPSGLTAVYACVFFGLSMGSIAVVLRALLKTPGYLAIVFIMILLYLSSGVSVPIVPTSEAARTMIGLNPIYQLVEWMRSAFFETNTTIPVNKPYVLLLSSSLFALALLGERLFRGKILNV